MAVTYVGASTINGVAANPPSFDITLPALNADDIIIISVTSRNIVEATSEINTPSGYTEIGTKYEIDAAAASEDMRTALFYKRAVGGDSGATVTISRAGVSTLTIYAVATVWRGATTSGSPFDTTGIAVSGDVTLGDVIVFPAFDPTATDVHVIYLGWKSNDVTDALANFTNDSTTFVIRNDQEITVGTDGTFGAWSADRNGNALSAVSVDVIGGDGSYVGYSFALLPASTGYTMSAAIGSLLLTGIDASLLFKQLLTAASGTYVLTGAAATLSKGYRIVAEQGSYALTGNTAGLLFGRNLISDTGAYSLTGNIASLLFGRKMVSDAGEYILTGNVANVLFNRLLTATVGEYVLMGVSNNLLLGRLLSAAQGAYTLTGLDVTLTIMSAGDYVMTASPGTYALTGNTVALLFKRIFIASIGDYVLTGNTSELLFGRKLSAVAGSYILTGNAIDFARTRVLTTALGVYLLSGRTASLIYSNAPVAIAHYIYVIESEDRVYVIPAEPEETIADRTFAIPYDFRSMEIEV